MTHGCGACLAIIVIILVLLLIIGIVLFLIHPEIGVKLKEIWSILGQIWTIIK